MDIREKINLAICLMLVLGGTLFSIIAWREWQQTGRIIKLGQQTQGVVVEMARRNRKVGEKGRPNSFAPVVVFTTDKGTEQKYFSTFYTALSIYQVGQTVDIWYLPNEPEKATLKGGDAWILPVAFGVFGVALCLIGYPWLFGIIRQKLSF